MSKSIEEMQIEFERLQRENAYLRQLLNLDLHLPLIISEAKPSDSNIVDAPIENTEIKEKGAKPMIDITPFSIYF